MVPNDLAGNLGVANREAKGCGMAVNGRLHSEIQAVPAARLAEEHALMRYQVGPSVGQNWGL